MNPKFSFKRLDAKTRSLMVEEISLAHKAGELYYSTRFNRSGQQNWLDWLDEAAKGHDEHWLAYQIEAAGAMKHFETRAKPKGGYTVAHVPDTAAETLADGQFNRFYIAAICRRAIDGSIASVVAYRAKQRGVPREESVELEGTALDAARLLNEVRNKGLSLHCELLKPNSGLSVD